MWNLDLNDQMFIFIDVIKVSNHSNVQKCISFEMINVQTRTSVKMFWILILNLNVPNGQTFTPIQMNDRTMDQFKTIEVIRVFKRWDWSRCSEFSVVAYFWAPWMFITSIKIRAFKWLKCYVQNDRKFLRSNCYEHVWVFKPIRIF